MCTELAVGYQGQQINRQKAPQPEWKPASRTIIGDYLPVTARENLAAFFLASMPAAPAPEALTPCEIVSLVRSLHVIHVAFRADNVLWLDHSQTSRRTRRQSSRHQRGAGTPCRIPWGRHTRSLCASWRRRQLQRKAAV